MRNPHEDHQDPLIHSSRFRGLFFYLLENVQGVFVFILSVQSIHEQPFSEICFFRRASRFPRRGRAGLDAAFPGRNVFRAGRARPVLLRSGFRGCADTGAQRSSRHPRGL